MDNKKIYIAIDLKSFYASVECVARGLDPLTTNLLVADVSKTEKTICSLLAPMICGINPSPTASRYSPPSGAACGTPRYPASGKVFGWKVCRSIT